MLWSVTNSPLDPRFRTNPDRVAHFAETVGLVQEIIRQKPRDHWVEFLERRRRALHTREHDLGPRRAPSHGRARGIILDYAHPSLGAVKGVATPIVFDGSARRAGTPPPVLGEHTAEVLASLGFTSGEIARLDEKGTISLAA